MGLFETFLEQTLYMTNDMLVITITQIAHYIKYKTRLSRERFSDTLGDYIRILMTTEAKNDVK